MPKILIASPDPRLSTLLYASLADLDADVAVAADDEELVLRCQWEPYDLILTLLLPPFLNGNDLVQRIRPRGAAFPKVYFLTWLHNEQLVLSLLESGVDQFITLPVNVPRLRGKVLAQLHEAADD